MYTIESRKYNVSSLVYMPARMQFLKPFVINLLNIRIFQISIRV